MTHRLYLSDSGLLEFEATVTAARELSGRTAVLLDRTAFYPEGGGQPADHGTIAGVPVVDVQDDGGEILHVLDGPAPAGQVACRVDGARRRDHVQQHHGQHLLSAAFEATRSARTLSFHLGEITCTIDLDAPAATLGDDALRAVEAAANDLVFRDLPVVARELSAEELAALPLRKAPTKGARVVVVSDPGAAGVGVVDASPCGGTHPRRTGEVGAIAVLGAQKWGAGSRVEFVCGGRVVAALAQARSRLGEAARALRCAPAELPAVAARAAEDGAARRKEVERLLLALAAVEAERLAGQGGGAVRAVVVPPAPGAAAFVKAVAAALAARGRVALVGAVEDGRAHLAFARPRGEGPHLGELVRAAAVALSGKGGGAPDLAQGSGPDASRLEAALAEAEAALTRS
ncbi:alanyl-tRNA editing protein [Anaeromyxobacter terrae]|uniref:alanyl-tRNA editing protein n=1 Tax=Anaeromyxobacter terrae TaxID=2925406 RepID=UPI001F58EB3C|nr:DHHA1 domain-containing protein [Anaeromyxobacter sp. SG22]